MIKIFCYKIIIPKYSEYSVCLGQECSINNRKAQSHSKPLKGAAGNSGFGKQQKRIKKTQKNTRQKNIA